MLVASEVVYINFTNLNYNFRPTSVWPNTCSWRTMTSTRKARNLFQNGFCEQAKIPAQVVPRQRRRIPSLTYPLVCINLYRPVTLHLICIRHFRIWSPYVHWKTICWTWNGDTYCSGTEAICRGMEGSSAYLLEYLCSTPNRSHTFRIQGFKGLK